MKEKSKKAPVIHNKEANPSLKDKIKERKPPLPKFQKPVRITALKHNTSLSESDLASSVDSSDASDNISIHSVDDMHSSEGTVVDEIESAQEIKVEERDKCEEEKMPSSVSAETVSSCNGNDKEDGMSDGCNDEESESDNEKDSASSQEEAVNVMHENKVKRASRVPKNLSNKLSPESSTSRVKIDQQSPNVLPFKSTSRRSHKGDLRDLDLKSMSMKVHAVFSSESEGSEDKATEDEETGDAQETSSNNDKLTTEQKIQEMEERISTLEEELRDIAALEISLYSVVPEHGSSAHKVHTPARRLSRFHIHACKHWTKDKRASIAKNTVSGLVLIAKSCGSDVPRLTYWWSNTVVLREIITQAFGAHHAHLNGKPSESNGGGKVVDGRPQLHCKKKGSSKQLKAFGFMQFEDDWQENSTFIAALEKVESWMFSRVVESVWWQSLTPHMQQPPIEEMYSERSAQILGPALGDQQQGSFSINIWRSAFLEAFQRICPVRGGGHECGCLPVLARMVMEQCVARLDVAMFNAILRESAHEMPTDPVSDPIVDSKVLPIPDGNLSFGSGAQLKNSVGNWSRYLAGLLGMPGGDVAREEDKVDGGGESDRGGSDEGSKYFHLLNALSDLLMLPKDMLVEKSIRKEVCPTLGSSIIKRILCNFTPDEFCPDPVPGSVLEALNSESNFERRQSDDGLINSFPCLAAPVVYRPPAAGDVAEKIGDAGRSPQLGRNGSLVQTKGSTSDEELDELDSPLTSIIDKTTSPRVSAGFAKHTGSEYHCGSSVRYDLLREVWLG